MEFVVNDRIEFVKKPHRIAPDVHILNCRLQDVGISEYCIVVGCVLVDETQ
jgi:hypothetical protein